MSKKKFESPEAMESFFPGRMKQEDLEVTGVSRSGRVRKKSSKLTDFESPDEIDNRYKRRDAGPVPNTPLSGSGRGRKLIQGGSLERPVQVNIKMEYQGDLYENEDMPEDYIPKSEPVDSESDSEMGMFPTPDGIEDDSSMDSLGSEEEEEDEEEDEEVEDDHLMMDDRGDNSRNGRRETQDNLPSSQAQSLYMLEKSSKKKLVIRDGKIVGRMKAQRKDKGKTRFTAYMLWAKEIRQEILKTNPDMDFATMSKRLGELWATVPNNEKYNWKRRAKRLAVKGGGRENQMIDATRWKAPPSKSKFINKIGGRGNVSTPETVRVATQRQPSSSPTDPTPPKASGKASTGSLVVEPVVGPGLYKVVGTQPVDVAAHLKLLGESLSIIGERLKEHEGQIAVSGSLSVLLDSLLCALGPLLCLTQQVTETNSCPPEMMAKILDNIAYFMPGL